MPETKTCPDCAETVLAGARVCRFCGYRFDGRRRARLGLLGTLLPSAGSPAATLPELLADWGVALGAGEDAAFFRPAGLDGRKGFLLVTSERLLFLTRTPGKGAEALEHPLGDVTAERAARGRRLVLRAGGASHELLAAGRRDAARLERLLAAPRQR